MIETMARWSARRPRSVVAGWLAVLAGMLLALGVFGGPTSDAVSIPGSDSQAAQDVQAKFPGGASGMQPLVLHTGADEPALTSAVTAEAVRSAARAIAGVPHVVAVTTPYDKAGAAAMSSDGHTAYLALELDVAGRDITPEVTSAVLDAARPAARAGIEVTPGGALAAAEEKGSTRHSELIGLAAAFAILFAGFGSAGAAGVPLAFGIVGLGISLAAVGLLGHVMDMPESGSTIAAMIGLGVGIDYILFCLTRFLELRAPGLPAATAPDIAAQRDDTAALVAEAVRSTAASGRAVVFAGASVITALAGLALGGLPLLHALALAPGIAVLIAVAATVTLLPAVLTLVGHRLTPRARPSRKAGRPRTWHRIAVHVTLRPWRYLLVSLALLTVLAVPAAQLSFGVLDAGSQPRQSSSRTAHDRLADAFGPGVNGTLHVTDTLAGPASGPSDSRITAVGSALSRTPGVASVGPPQLSADGTQVRWQVTPTTATSDPATARLVDRLRHDTLPRATGDTGRTAHVGGAPATQHDLNERLAQRLPQIMTFVVTVAALLLLLAFRSLPVAVGAALMNLVSIGAAYGVLTAVFSWGWGTGLIGLDGPVPIPGYVPLVMFAVLFGLSMDYQVFLLTAVREAFTTSRDARRSVVDGLTGTGRIITSAALIMVCVFLSYLLSDDAVVKMFGVGLAAAVALDATVVRMLLMPTGMLLLGRVTWWLPGWLDRLLPHVRIEDGPDTTPARPARDDRPSGGSTDRGGAPGPGGAGTLEAAGPPEKRSAAADAETPGTAHNPQSTRTL